MEFTDLKGIFNRLRLSGKHQPKSPNAIPQNLKPTIIARTILKYLNVEGRLLFDPFDEMCFYYDKEKRIVFDLGKEFVSWLEVTFGIRRAQETNETLALIESHCRTEGERVSVHSQTHFDPHPGVLCIFDQDKNYYVATGEGKIYKEPNGSNGHFFRKNRGDARKIIYQKEREEYTIENVIVKKINFAQTPALSPKHQQFLLRLYLYSLPFHDFLNTKPLLSFLGEKGSGKTVAMRLIGKVFMGLNFQVRPIPDNEEDFYVALTSNPLVFFDNVDCKKGWLENALACAASGGDLAKRELYTTFDEAVRRIKAFVGINSREPYFNRDDVADRMIILRVNRLSKFIPENALFKPIEEHWDDIWGNYIDDLDEIVCRLNEIELSERDSTHRLADWAVIAEIINEALQIEQPKFFHETMMALQRERWLFALEIAPLLREGMQELFSQGPKGVDDQVFNPNVGIQASQLLEKLNNIHPAIASEVRSPQSLGQKLSRLEEEFRGSGIPIHRKYKANKKAWFYFFKDNRAGMRVSNSLPSRIVNSKNKIEEEEDSKTTNTRIPAIHELFQKMIEEEVFSPGDFIQLAEPYGHSEDQCLEYIERMKFEGVVYQPYIGRLTVVPRRENEND